MTRSATSLLAASLLLISTIIAISASNFGNLLDSALAVDPSCSPTSDTATVPGYTILSFTATGTCTWNSPSGISTLDSLLVVGGGGGGAGGYDPSNTDGAGAGGGGGAYSATTVSIPSSVTIQVGSGGTGGVHSSNRYGNYGAQGSPSAFGTITAGGGGGGGCDSPGTGSTCSSASANGGNGTAAGSGGGSSNYYSAYNAGTAGTASNATFNGNIFNSQSGFNGGYYNQGGTSATGSGGPGGGARGSANYNTRGSGLTSSITGTSAEYGKGGGAFGVSGWTFSSSTSGYGTGGDGQWGNAANGATGAQGIVIVKYKNIPTATTTAAAGNFVFRTTKTVSVISNLAGKLTVRANNIPIPGCKNVAVAAYTPKTCNYKAIKIGFVTLVATVIPTDVSFTTATSQIGPYFVFTRSNTR